MVFILKAAIVVSTPDAEFEALAFKDSLTKSVRKVAELGYDGVEIAVRNPQKIDIDEINSIVKNSGLQVPAVGTGQAFLVEGLSLSSSDKGIREKTQGRLMLQVDFAANFGAAVILGLIRGNVEEGVNRNDAYMWLIEGVRRCAEYASTRGLSILIEPINRYEVNYINTVSEVLELIDAVSMENVYVLVDTFHMNIEEPDMVRSIKQAGSKIGHVHVADSNRWAPGFGHIDFVAIKKALDEVGYNGYISAEILPMPNPDTAAKKAIQTMRQVFGW